MEKFLREPVTLELLEELLPLFVEHDRAVAQFQDIRLNPNYEFYLSLEAAGRLRAFVARDAETNAALGYSAFIVMENPQRKESLIAQENVLFIHPEARGFGGAFVDWCDFQLQSEGVQVVYRHVKPKPDLNFSPLLERKGYELAELVWAKRLDRSA